MKIPLILVQGFRFALVGALNTLITWLIFLLLYRILHTGEIVANITGYVIGAINSFILNKLWTFRSRDRQPGTLMRETLLFLLVFAISLGGQFLLFRFLLEQKMIVEVAELFSMVVYTGLNFIGNRFLTFRKGKDGLARERLKD